MSTDMGCLAGGNKSKGKRQGIPALPVNQDSGEPRARQANESLWRLFYENVVKFK